MEYTKSHRSAVPSQYKGRNAASQTSSGQIPNSVLCDVMSGKKQATSEMMGHRENLAASVTAKMNRAFGMDFSGVKVYRSDAMSDSGVQGLAQGNRIVLSKKVNLNTLSGQAVLGHEFSHIHAQSQGIGLGHSGLYNDAILEHQADSEGMMAARGLSFNGSSLGMETAPGMQGISSLSPLGPGMSASAGAPMQAKDKKGKPKSDADYGKNAIHNAPAADGKFENPIVDNQSDDVRADSFYGELDDNEISDDENSKDGQIKTIINEANDIPLATNGKKSKAPKEKLTAKKFFGGMLGGIGRGLQGLGVGLNLLTGGHLIGSAYNKLSYDKGVGQAIGKGLLAIPSFILNAPSTLIGTAGAMMSDKGREMYNKDWLDHRNQIMGDQNSKKGDSSEDNKIIFNKTDEGKFNEIKFRDLVAAGGTNLANRFINPGQDSRKSWIVEKARKNHGMGKGGVAKRAAEEYQQLQKDRDAYVDD